jgi:hypothetical protein
MPTTTMKGGGLLIPVNAPPNTFAARLRQALQQFEAQLKETENFKIIATVGSRAYGVEHITVRGSELVVIDGPAEDTNRYRIMCHVNALQLMLLVEPKAPHEKRRPIGFIWEPETAGDGEDGAEAVPEEVDGPPPLV